MLSNIIKGINSLFSNSNRTDSTGVIEVPSLLFVQNIKNGVLKEELLSIQLSSPTLFFSDRPYRLTGHVTNTFLLDLWHKGQDDFQVNPPNAVLSVIKDDKISNTVLELRSSKMEQGKIEYAVNVISGEPLSGFDAATLFIDAFPTSVNNQITDAVTQTNVKILGDAPATSMGNLFIATSQALSNAAHNATTAQQQTDISAQAATAMGVATLYSIDTASTGKATSSTFN